MKVTVALELVCYCQEDNCIFHSPASARKVEWGGVEEEKINCEYKQFDNAANILDNHMKIDLAI